MREADGNSVMAFDDSKKHKTFDSKVWLASPTMHGEEIEYVKEAYELMEA